MDTREVDYRTILPDALEKLASPGFLLMGGSENPNPMAIGWATWGIIWSMPVCTVLVRPSRHTFKLLEAEPFFTVNVPADGMDDTVMFCGTHSGRDLDKIKACNLDLGRSARVPVPCIKQCTAHFECRVIQTAHVRPEHVLSDNVKAFYDSGDYHTIFHGELLGAFAADRR